MIAFARVHPKANLLHISFLFSLMWIFPISLHAQVPDACGDVENLALGKPTTQSSLYGLGFASLGVDGDKDGTRGPWENASLAHTQREENPWWEVDLETVARIQTVKIYNRTDCCQDRMNNFFLLFSDFPIDPAATFSDLLADSSVTALNFIEPVGDSLFVEVNTTGRYVRIQLGTNSLLHFAELEVIGCNENTCVTSPLVEVVPTDAQTCAGNGSVVVSATPDAGAFSIRDAAGDLVDSLSSLAQGDYTWEFVYFGCQEQGAFSIGGPPLPLVSIDPAGPFIIGVEPQQLSASPTGGSWGGEVSELGIFDPGIGAGDYEVYYTVTDSESCTSSDTLMISVLEVIDVEAPTTPLNLAITDSGLTSISLSWQRATDNVSVAGYYIYRDGISPPSDTIIGDVESFLVENLAPNTMYQFAVSAYDLSGNVSLQSQAVSGKTLTCGMEIVEIDVIDETTCGARDGSIVIKATGQNLEFSIDGGNTYQDDNTFVNLGAGAYDIFIQEVDLNACFLSERIVLTAPGSPEVLSTSLSVPPEGCGNSNGIILIQASEGDWEYSIDGGESFQLDSNFSELGGGIFPIIVRNIEEPTCAVSDTLIFLEPANPEILSADKVDPGACGSDENAPGSIFLDVLADNPEYSIDGGDSFQSSPEFPELIAGSYTVVVREIDNPNCRVSEQVVLENISGPNLVTIDQEDPSECDSRDGKITLLATGDSLEYSINGGLSFQISNVFPDLIAGSYPIVIRKSGQNSCMVTDTISLAGRGTPINFSVETVNSVDCSTPEGAITIVSTGQNLEYSIDGGETFQTSPSFSGLSVGEYVVLVQESDSAGCKVSETVQISAENGPQINTTRTQDPTDCGSEDGQITVFASGNGLSYSIDGGITFQTSNIFPSLGIGTYTIVVREQDNSGCVAQQTLLLEDRFSPSISEVNIEDPTLCGVANGRVSIFAEGINLEYSIDGGESFQGANVFSNLLDGTYAIAVRNSQQMSCITFDSVALESPERPVFEDFQISEPACEGSDGNLEVFAIGTSLEYSIDGGLSFQGSNRFVGLASGSYTVTIRERNSEGCNVSEQVIIGVRDIPEIESVQESPTSNCNEFDGKLSISANGTGLEYSIDGGTTYSSQKDFEGLGEGTYFIFVRSGSSSECVASTIAEISDPLECGLLSKNQVSVSTSPNPFSNTFTLGIVGNIDPEATMEIINPLGQTLYRKALEGQNEFELGQTMSEGIYYVILRSGINEVIIKVLKQE